VFVFVGLALLARDVGEESAPGEELHGWLAITLLVTTFAGLILVALLEVRNQRNGRRGSARPGSELPVQLPGSGADHPSDVPLHQPYTSNVSDLAKVSR
jgi:hypothetical protein